MTHTPLRKRLLLAMLLMAAVMHSATAASQTGARPDPFDPPCVTHDPIAVHALWDAAGDCHYDHSHGVTQNELETFFRKWGLPTDRISGDPLVLSVQTPRENERKHSGYRWTLYEVEDGCHKDDKGLLDKNGRDDNCIVAFAARIHDLGGVHEVTTKTHSLALYTVACMDAAPSPYVEVPDRTRCGWSYTEQAATFGPEEGHEVHAPYKQGFAAGFEGDGSFSPPYIGARTIEQCETRKRQQRDCVETWNSSRASTPDAPSLVNFDYRNYDAPQGINPSDPLHQQPLGGKYNNSERHIYVVILKVPGTGMVTASGTAPLCLYADEEPCRPSGVWQLHNYPAGLSAYVRVGGQKAPRITVQDVDIYFNGQPSGWLKVHQPRP